MTRNRRRSWTPTLESAETRVLLTATTAVDAPPVETATTADLTPVEPVDGAEIEDTSPTTWSGGGSKSPGSPPPGAMAKGGKWIRNRLGGVVDGTYDMTSELPVDGPIRYAMKGNGTIKGIGPATIAASMEVPGFAPRSRATGRVTIETATGTMVLKLTGPLRAGGSPPGVLNYRVISSTGSLRRRYDTGTIALKLTPDNPVDIGSPAGTGRFTLRFNSGAAPV